KAINADQPDWEGVTPLMHAAALGHCKVVQLMMEHKRSGAVSIDIDATDNNGHTANDHASFSGLSGAEIQDVLHSYSGDVGSVRCPKPPGPGDEIELMDMSAVAEHDASKEDRYLKHTPADKTHSLCADIVNWASEIKEQHLEAERLSSLIPPLCNSRPGSKLEKSRHGALSSLSVPETLYGRPNSPSRLRNKSSNHATDDDEEDFSLESLSDLLGTVRQYAKEIHEIYAPIQKDKEERVRRNMERKEKKKSKDVSKHAKENSDQVFKPGHHEVRVEIHRIEDQMKQRIIGGGKGRVNHSKSQEPSPTHPVASLHVENEQLSSTWPRGRYRPQSQEMFWSDTNISRHNSMKASTSSAGSSRPPLPSEWNEMVNLRNEKDILNKAFQRLNIPSKDPLVEYKKIVPNQKIQQQLISSRQSVIDAAKQHLQTSQVPLPSISIIPPPSERGKSWARWGGVLPSAPPTEDDYKYYEPPATPTYDNESRDIIIPIGPLVSDETPHRQSKNGGVGVKSSSKVGLRRRKSVDQGLGQGAVILEKY
ncbi:hypothetical protein Btru_065125, partial [Bulinus truncatus]